MEGLKLKEADFVMGLETENSLEWPDFGFGFQVNSVNLTPD